MQRRLTQLLHWLGLDSIALGIPFGVSLLFLPLALWKPGCLLAFTHLQWVLILCSLVRNGWLRTFRFNCELGGGYLTWLQAAGYDGRRPPPFHSPLRTPWDLLALGLLLGYAGLLTRVTPFYFWTGGTPEPFIFGVLPLAWFLADLFGTLTLCKLLRQRTAELAAAWLLPAMLMLVHHPYALLAIGVCQFVINQWTLRRGLRALPQLPPAGEIKDPFSIVGGMWAALAGRLQASRSRAQRWWIPLLVAWWTLTLTPNVEFIWSSKFLVTSSMVVLLIFWGFTTFVKRGVGFPQFLALGFGADYAWRGWRWMIGPLLGLALLRLLWQSDALFLQTAWPLPGYAAVTVLLLLKLVLEWNALTANWTLTGVQQCVRPIPRFALSMEIPTSREQWAKLYWFRLEPVLKETKSPSIHHPSIWQLLLRLRLSRWRGNYLTRIGQDALLMLGLMTLLAWFFARFMQDRELPPLAAFMLVIVASFGYSVRRLYEFFPPMNRRYREFLRGTAWQPGIPLPLGPSHIHWIDFAVVLGTTAALFLMSCFFFDIPHISSHSRIMLAAILLLCSIWLFLTPRMICGIWFMLKSQLFGYLSGIGLLAPLFVLFRDNPPVLIGTAISIAIINEFGLQAALRQFPWPEKQAPNWSRCYQTGQSPGLPLALLDYPPMAPNWGWLLYIGPFMPKHRFARSFGISLLLLSAWWSAIFLYALKDDARENAMVGSLLGLFMIAIVSLGLRVLHAEAAMNPLGLLGRLKFGHALILWKYDRLTLQALGIIGLEVALVFYGFSQHWPALYAIPAAIVLFPLALYYGLPNAGRYCLTGIHRIRLRPRNRR